MDEKDTTAYELAELVLSMNFTSPAGAVARQLARRILGVTDGTMAPPMTAIVTNGTLRLLRRDEPVFLLRGQDILAPDTVRHWGELARANGKDALRVQAQAVAKAMEEWIYRRLPDWPPNTERTRADDVPSTLNPPPPTPEPAKKRIEYILIDEPSRVDLDTAVREKLAKGWVPQGGASVAVMPGEPRGYGDDGGRWAFIQAMTREV